MLEIKDHKKIKMKIYGEEYEVRSPRVGHLKQVQDDLKKNKEKGLDVTIKFLVDCGLPEKVVNDLEPDHLEAIVEYLSGSKKN